ncbi:MAG: DUF5104 domain-containing protein [Lachnospiraceae bacterium]|nr:DUF5104 domain-containing protein [Lachnospiraceae bacterium]
MKWRKDTSVEGGDILAFASMIFAFMVIILLILGILLVAGLIFLVIGIVKKKNPKNQGKKQPIVFIMIGSLLALPAAVVIVIVLTAFLTVDKKTAANQIQYESVPDKWRNEWVNDHKAAQEVLDALLKAADAKDIEAFAMNFTPEIQKQSNFDESLDTFFKSYPEGFSEVDIKIGPVSSGGSFNYGHNVRDAGTSVEVVMDGEWYAIGLSFCYENTDNPDKVGVTYFSIMNLEGAACYRDKSSKNQDSSENKFLTCSIMSDEEISARLINGMPFLWTDTPNPKLTEDEMRELLTTYRDKGLENPAIYDVIGEPNASFKVSNATGYDYYYELAQKEDGTPQYVNICTSTEKGKIIDAYLCDDEKKYFDNPIVEYIKTQ